MPIYLAQKKQLDESIGEKTMMDHETSQQSGKHLSPCLCGLHATDDITCGNAIMIGSFFVGSDSVTPAGTKDPCLS